MTDRRVERDDPRDHGQAGGRPPERRDQRDEHVRRRREATRERPVEAEQRRVETDREQRAELEVEGELRVAGEAELRAEALHEEKRPDDAERDRERSERSRRAAEDDVGREPTRQRDPVAHPDDAPEQERRADERIHLISGYQARTTRRPNTWQFRQLG